MKLSTETAAETLTDKPYTMEIEDEIDSLKTTIKALRRNAAEDNCYIDALEEAIKDAKASFHAGENAWDMYKLLTRTDIKTK
jgi:DNA-binding transcriptional regulator GbsR (MarR family)